MDRLLESDAIGHAAHGVFAFQLLEFNGCVLIKELVEGEIAAAHLDLNLVSDTAHPDTLSTELVHAFRLPHEHDFQLLAVRVVIDVLS